MNTDLVLDVVLGVVLGVVLDVPVVSGTKASTVLPGTSPDLQGTTSNVYLNTTSVATQCCATHCWCVNIESRGSWIASSVSNVLTVDLTEYEAQLDLI